MSKVKALTLSSLMLALSGCNLTIENTGGGKVIADDSAINCGEECQASYNTTTTVTLTATADSGFLFSGWDGACSGQESCVVTMGPASGHKNVIASFDKIKTIADLEFADPAFEKCVTTFAGQQSMVNIADMTFLRCNQQSVKSLAGIEQLKALKSLEATSNEIESADFSLNKGLEEVDLRRNKLTSINVTENGALSYLDLRHNELTAIDVKNNPLLEQLYLNTNKVTEVDVSLNPELAGLDLNFNDVTSLDLTANPLLSRLWVGGNELSEIDLSQNPELFYVVLSSNNLTTINVDNNTKLSTLLLQANNFTEETKAYLATIDWIDVEFRY